MNKFVVLCALAVAVKAATIPESAPTQAAEKKEGIKEKEVTKEQDKESAATDPFRFGKQIYPAGYQPAVYYAAPKSSVFSPYAYPAAPAYPAAAPAYAPFPNYYPGYPSFPAPQYYPLREDGANANEEGSYWSQYFPSGFSNIGSYFSNYPSYYPSSWFGTSEAENSGATQSASAEGSNAAQKAPAKSNNVPAPFPGQFPAQFNTKPIPAVPQPQFADNKFKTYQPAQQFIIPGQPQFYGQYSPFQAQQDPSKLTAANNGAISSYLFLRNQPQVPVFQQGVQELQQESKQVETASPATEGQNDAPVPTVESAEKPAEETQKESGASTGQ